MATGKRCRSSMRAYPGILWLCLFFLAGLSGVRGARLGASVAHKNDISRPRQTPTGTHANITSARNLPYTQSATTIVTPLYPTSEKGTYTTVDAAAMRHQHLVLLPPDYSARGPSERESVLRISATICQTFPLCTLSTSLNLPSITRSAG